MEADIIIVGAGPSGLCFAKALSGQGLRIAIIEQQDQDAIAQPAFDGREIALTQRSAKVMQDLGLWSRIDPHALSPLRDAKVLDGGALFEMLISHQLSSHSELGWLVSNHLIRQAAYEAVLHAQQEHHDITVITGQKVVKVSTQSDSAQVILESGEHVNAKLIVAADNRFSTTRRMMGIAADMHDFGRNMLVCCMTHDLPHHHIAWEWFDYGQTLALLPMNPDPETGRFRSSVVITVPSDAIEALMQASPEDFAHDVERRFKHRLGAMQLVSTKHAYPLVSVYPDQLVAERFATIGDAAVGMHPVTAHGFNFGLLGVTSLAEEILRAHKLGMDIGASFLLRRYENKHRLKTRPLYLMTRLITDIYTNETPPAKIARKALLHLSARFTPLKRAIAASLTGH